jgi:hypothetical protein
MRAEGIELLPIGQTVIATKQLIDFQLRKIEAEHDGQKAVGKGAHGAGNKE